MEIIQVKLGSIAPNPINPSTREPDEELIESIRARGIVTPLLVKTNGSASTFVLIAGSRRFQAAKKLGLDSVPCIVQSVSGEADANALLLVDNIHRKNMSIWEEYQVITELLKTNTAASVAKQLGKSTKYVMRRTGLANCIPEVQEDLKAGCPSLTERMAYVFAKLPASTQKHVWQQCSEDTEQGTIYTVSEADMERKAKENIQERLLEGKMKPAEILKVYPSAESIAHVSVETAVETLFVDSCEAAANKGRSEESLKLAKKMLKEVKDAVRLSTNTWHYSDDVLCESQWREATQSDDVKEIEDGIMLDGENAGAFCSFVRVKEVKTDKNGKAKVDDRSEKQKEADRKKRREKILTNKATNAAISRLFHDLGTKPFPMKTGFDFLVEHYGQARKILRQYLSAEDYKKVSWEQQDRKFKAYLALNPPEKALTTLFFGPYTTFYPEEVAKVFGIDFKAVVNDERKRIEAEIAKKLHDKQVVQQAKKAKLPRK